MTDTDAVRTDDPLASLAIEEAQHRARNLVALAIALAHQSLAEVRHHPGVIAFIDRLRSLDAVARIGCEVAGDYCSIERIAEQVTQRLDDPLAPRITLSGPHVALASRWAHMVAIVLHELTANALRHGALSNATGRVALRWTITQDEIGEKETLKLVWREVDGPPVTAYVRHGFGTRLLRDLVVSNRRCEATLRLPPNGLVYKLALRLEPSELRL